MPLSDDHQKTQDTPTNLSFEQFQGVNTATTRPGVQDSQAYWLDGFMPLAPGNARTLWGIGSSIFSPPVGEISSVSIVSAGSGGAGGPFTNVPLTGGSGTGAQATITLTGGSVSSVGITDPGQNYSVSNVLSANSASIGSVVGFSVSVASIINPTIECFYFYNIGSTAYSVVFLSDGSAYQINTSTSVSTVILPPLTIANPTITNIGVSQWGSQYLLISANQSNGYWIWDGSLLYQAGTVSPIVTITNVGSGYATPPAVNASGGHGFGSSYVAVINGGEVTSVKITNPGSGYVGSDNPSVPLVFSSGTGGSGASITASIIDIAGGSGATYSLNYSEAVSNLYKANSITVTNGGSGYTSQVIAYFTGGSWYNGGVPSIQVGRSSGVITQLNIVPNGSNPDSYFYFSGGIPSIVVSDTGYYTVDSTTIVAAGSDYGPNATITATGGGSPQSQASLSPVIANGSIASVTINNGGVYLSNSTPTLTVTDTATTAAGYVTLMPFGVQGTAIETYQGHVWVFNGNVYNFSAPGSVVDFATSAGGGSQQSSSSYLKVGYTNAVSTNGFLFLLGDSSMDYISGVQTSGTPPTTTYTQNNSDPEIGTPYPAAVTTLGQDILIANSTGIFVSSGGAFVKQSEPLDGVFNTVPNFNGLQLSSAKATIFGKRVWMVLATIIDPVSNAQVNKLLMYNGKIWWASVQDVSLIFIQGQEINSTYTAWGTDGTHLYPLFQQPSFNFTKVAQSKLWADPGGYETTKTTNRFWSVWTCNSTVSTAFTVDIDAVGIDANYNQFTNTSSYPITGPTQEGFFVTLPLAVGQQGVITGMTITTNATDMTLISAKIGDMSQDYRG